MGFTGVQGNHEHPFSHAESEARSGSGRNSAEYSPHLVGQLLPGDQVGEIRQSDLQLDHLLDGEPVPYPAQGVQFNACARCKCALPSTPVPHGSFSDGLRSDGLCERCFEDASRELNYRSCCGCGEPIPADSVWQLYCERCCAEHKADLGVQECAGCKAVIDSHPVIRYCPRCVEAYKADLAPNGLPKVTMEEIAEHQDIDYAQEVKARALGLPVPAIVCNGCLHLAYSAYRCEVVDGDGVPCDCGGGDR